jgi:hypothetical protein
MCGAAKAHACQALFLCVESTVADGTLIAVARQQFLDVNGKPIPGAKLYSYLAGTTTPAPLYADSSLTVPLSNPAIADGSGRLTAYMPSNTTYKLELRTSTDVSVWIQDGVQGVPSNEVDLDIESIAGEALADRDVVFLSNGTGGTTPGRWYKGDADIVARSTGANIIGIVPQAIAAGASGTFRVQGKVLGFSGLTPGAAYYISQVAGQLTSIAPANARFIGIADTTTTLVMTVGGVAQSQPADPVFNTVQISSSAATALDVAGGIQAGTGNVQVVDATGKIPAIDATRFASLSGANLTGIPETAIADGALLARLAANETITGLWDFDAPQTFSAASDRNIIVVTNNGNAIAIRIRGRTSDNLANIDFTDSSETIAFGSIGITPGGGLTYTGPLTGHTFVGPIALTGALKITAAISPPALVADTHNYNPAGLSTARIIRIDGSGGFALTGIVAQPAGTVLSLICTAGAIGLPRESVSSTAANRFNFDQEIRAAATAENMQGGITIWYDGASSRWQQIG